MEPLVATKEEVGDLEVEVLIRVVDLEEEELGEVEGLEGEDWVEVDNSVGVAQV